MRFQASEKGIGAMSCLWLHDFVKGTEMVISMPRSWQDQGMENSYKNILRSDERTAALIESHQRFLLNLEKVS
jgi:hypothetical protein